MYLDYQSNMLGISKADINILNEHFSDGYITILMGGEEWQISQGCNSDITVDGSIYSLSIKNLGKW